jgi:hypothetical protein
MEQMKGLIKSSMDSVVKPEINPKLVHLRLLHFETFRSHCPTRRFSMKEALPFQCSCQLCKLQDYFIWMTFILSTANTDHPVKPPFLFMSIGRWDHHQSGFSSRASLCITWYMWALNWVKRFFRSFCNFVGTISCSLDLSLWHFPCVH